MSVSQASVEFFSVSVPQPQKLSVEFKYNFFVNDEKTVEVSELKYDKFLQKTSEQLGSTYNVNNIKRIPRYVQLLWSPPTFNKQDFILEQQTPNLIKDNLDKIVTENMLSTNKFVSMTFQNANFNSDAYYMISGTYTRSKLNDLDHSNESMYHTAYRANALSQDVSQDFINELFLQPELALDVITQKNDNIKTHVETYIQQLNSSKLSGQLNVKCAKFLIQNAIDYSSNDVGATNTTLNYVTNIANNVFPQEASNDDYQTVVPYIDIQTDIKNANNLNVIKLIGFIIDKHEILSDNDVVDKEQTIIENPYSNNFIDLQCKYDTTYSYQIRAIYKMYLTAINHETGEIALLTLLVSSNPTSKQFVTCTEQVAPPPPVDINFIWDYKRKNLTNKPGSLMLHWALPVNPQRDIKYLQIFRRSNTKESFQLVKMFDFDDSTLKTKLNEIYDPNVIETTNDPILYWFDNEFNKTSRYIYAMSTIDAHGFISTYSAQFELWFDIFENSLKKKLVSHTGALRQYPNIFLENDLFIDSMKVSGQRSKSLDIFFNPEYYALQDDNKRTIPTLSTVQSGGRYVLQNINLDNQKSQLLTIKIDDILGKVK